MRFKKNTTFIAKTFYGLEEVLRKEISELGAQNIEVINRAIKFEGDKELLYKANLLLRTAIRILVPIKKLKVSSYDDLYNKAKEINWSYYLNPHNTIFINAFVNSPNFEHSHFASLRLKDAIADHFREKYNLRPSVDKVNPDYTFNLHIYKDECTLSLDSSGDSLHKRGYKVENVQAPLNEVLAAGLIMLTNWDKNSPFIDPMCGSGTLPIEAALMAHEIPPGKFRTQYGFTKWHNYDEELHQKIRNECFKSINDKKNIEIIGTDISEAAIEKSTNNAINAGLKNKIKFQTCSFENYSFIKPENGLLIINPPYDVKLKKEDINTFYKEIGDVLKNNFNGYDVWIFSGNKDAIKNIGLKPNKKISLYNGALPCQFQYFPIYKGSLKKKKLD